MSFALDGEPVAGITDSVRLSGVLREMSCAGLVEGDIRRMLGVCCQGSVALLGADGAGVLLLDDEGRLRCAAASDDQVFRLQAQQVDLVSDGRRAAHLLRDDEGPGPGTDSWASGTIPLVAGDECVGLLQLYRRDPEATLSPQDRIVAQSLADLAAGIVVQYRALQGARQLADQLQHALDSRVAIEQAKGILSAQLGVSPDAAFQALRRYSRSRRRRIRDMAAAVISGQVPGDELRAELDAANVVRLPPRRPYAEPG